jgi:serine/threonine protein kinase
MGCTEFSVGTVVKLLPVGALASSDSKIALLNEIRAAQQVKHPNVVQVLYVNDGAASQIGPYAVMEYVSGGSLAQVLRGSYARIAELPHAHLRACFLSRYAFD